MRFTYSFENWIWKNLRRSIRVLPQVSIWFIFLESILRYFENLTERINWLYDQVWLESSSGFGLDSWGNRYGIFRLPSENDSNYRSRIIYNLLIYRNSLTRKRKREILSELLGIPVEDILINNFSNTSTSRMGDKLPYSIFSKKAEIYTYQIIFPRALTSAERIIAVEFISRTNIGGNLPIFKETLPARDLFKMGENYNNWIQSKYSDEGVYYVY